jgi:rubrerythrin
MIKQFKGRKGRFMELNIPLEVGINCDGYYPYCKNCGYFDLEHEQERCPKCGQLQDWSWLEKGENNGL